MEPLAAKFCNGTTVTCEGLSQWGSQNLARQGYNSTQILRSYYGDVEIVPNAPIRGYTSSYPGSPLRRGSTGPNVVVIQVELNRISQNYPAIPKIPNVDGIFGSRTEASVRKFQEVFGLAADGIVGKETWYELVRIYTAVTRLSELRSQGQQYYSIAWNLNPGIYPGETGNKVRHLQYMLDLLSEFIPQIPPVTTDGIYGSQTADTVRAAQRWFGLPETGNVDEKTWDAIYDQFSGIENYALRNQEIFPTGQSGRSRYAASSTLTQFPGRNLSAGNADPVKQEVVR